MKPVIWRSLFILMALVGFCRAAEGPDRATMRIGFPDPRLRVHGLAWFEEDAPLLRRLPERMKPSLRPAVWSLAQHTSGGRIRLRTDSRRIAITAQAADASVMHHFTGVGQNGLDLYVDGQYLASAWPDAHGRIAADWRLPDDGSEHEVTIYLALYKNIAIEEVRLDASATIGAPSPFARPRPVVYYGSSITQGGCATNAGLSYQAIVSRWLNLDFVNLGMSGNGLGEPALAHAIAEIDSEAVVLDYWGNPSVEVYRETMPVFVDIIRQKRPDVPIIVIGPLYLCYERLAGPGTITDPEHKRRISQAFVEGRRAAGDMNIHYVDGREMISADQPEAYVDGVHPNSLGFYFCAQGLRPHLERIVGLGTITPEGALP